MCIKYDASAEKDLKFTTAARVYERLLLDDEERPSERTGRRIDELESNPDEEQ